VEDPRAVVPAFIADAYAWERAASERTPKGRASEEAWVASMEFAKSSYAELLAKYCRPGFVGQPPAYGDLPTHDPAREVVTGGKPRGDRCLIRTSATAEMLGQELSPNEFEYRLTRSDAAGISKASRS
jgi:hypothetical protein